MALVPGCVLLTVEFRWYFCNIPPGLAIFWKTQKSLKRIRSSAIEFIHFFGMKMIDILRELENDVWIVNQVFWEK